MKREHTRIFNSVWVVDFLDKDDEGFDVHFMENGEICYEGRCYHSSQHIVVRNDITPFRIKSTLIHEWLHAIIDMTGQEQNEHLIDALSTGIMDLLINDPFMVKFLSDTSDLRQAE